MVKRSAPAKFSTKTGTRQGVGLSKDKEQSLAKAILSSPSLPPSLLLLCPDTIRRERALSTLIDKFSKQEGITPELIRGATTKIDSSTINLDTLHSLKDQLSSLSLFSPAQVFILKNIDKLNAKVADSLLELCKGSDKILLILSGSTLPVSSKVYKRFVKNEAAIILSTPSSSEAIKWAAKEAKLLKLNCTGPILEALVTISENEALISEQPLIDLLHVKLERLSLYIDEGDVEFSHIDDLFPGSNVASEFEFVDQALLGNWAKSEPLLSTLLENGKNPFLLLALFSRSLTNVLLVRLMIERGRTQDEIRTETGLSPWVLGKVTKLAKSINLDRLLIATVEILKLDNRLKGAGLDDIHLFSSLLGNLTRP